jgi:hypothetical protein
MAVEAAASAKRTPSKPSGGANWPATPGGSGSSKMGSSPAEG